MEDKKKKTKTKKKVNKKKKSTIIKNKKVILLIIAFIILAIIVGVLVIKNNEEHNEPNETPSTESNDLATTPDYYSIINYLKLNGLPDEYFGYLYQNEKISQTEIDNQVKIYMAIRKVLTEAKTTDYTKKIEIKESEVTSALKQLFGQNVTFKHESLTGNTCSYTKFEYDEDKKLYIQNPEDLDDCNYSNDTILSKITEEKTLADSIEIYEKVAYVVNSYNFETKQAIYNIYTDMTKQTKIASANEYSIDNYLEQLNTYKYTFEKDNNNYYLKSVELVK